MAIQNTPEGTMITGDDIGTYAFVMLHNAVRFRVKTGGSLLRGQEARMAKNYGWSNAKQMKHILRDLDSLKEGFLKG